MTRKASATIAASRALLHGECENALVDAADVADENGFDLGHLSGSRSDDITGVTVKVAITAPSSA